MLNYILLVVGFAAAAFWSVLFLSNYKTYKSLIPAIDDDNYFLRDTLVVGLAIIKLFKIDYIKLGKRKRAVFAELYSKEYADFNILVCLAAQITYVLMFIPLGCFLAVLAGEPILAFLIILVGFFLAYYVYAKSSAKIAARHDELLLALPNVLSKMALLVNVGTTFREAWRLASQSTDGVLGEEMRAATKLVDNGMSEKDAYIEFADRCRIQQIKKMVSIICQNLEKGSSELSSALKEISIDAWNEKKHIVKRLGENANNKLIIPMMIMFAGVIIMIVVPIVANMNLSM